MSGCVALLTFAASFGQTTLFTDDFEDGDDDGWTVTQGNWDVIEGRYRPVGGQRNYSYAGDPTWSNYRVEVDVYLGEPDPTGSHWDIAFRVDPTSNPCVDHGCAGRQYILLYDPLTSELVLRYGHGSGTTDVLHYPHYLDPLREYRVTVTVIRFTVTVEIDGISFSYTFHGSDPLYSTGVIGVGHYREDGIDGGAYVDNIVVSLEDLCERVCQSTDTSLGMPATIEFKGGDGSWGTFGAEPVPNQFGIFFYGSTQTRLPFGNGFLCTGGGIVRALPPVVATGNRAEATIDLTSLSGIRYFQYWFRDPAAGGAFFNTTDALCCDFDAGG